MTVNGKESDVFQMNAGTPQGSIISPVLYAIFMLDIPRNNSPDEPKLIQFADDTSTYQSAKSLKVAARQINNYLKVLAEYYAKWKVKINPGKSEAIIFRRPSPYCGRNIISREKALKIEFESVPVPKKKSIKYLGVKLDYLWKFTEHAKYVLKKGQGAKSLLYPVMRDNDDVGDEDCLL